MSASLKKFVRDEFLSVSKQNLTKKASHVILGEDATYLIPQDNMKSFYKSYARCVSEMEAGDFSDTESYDSSDEKEEYVEEVEGRCFKLAEIPEEFAPIMVCLKSVYVGLEEIDSDFICLLANTIQRVSSKMGNDKSSVMYTPSLLSCVVLTRISTNGKDENPGHGDFMFCLPNAIASIESITKELYPQLIAALEKDIKNVQWSKLMDKRFYQEPIPMFGSSKDMNCYHYVGYCNYSLSTKCPLRDEPPEKNFTLPKTTITHKPENNEDFLVFLLSVRGHTKPSVDEKKQTAMKFPIFNATGLQKAHEDDIGDRSFDEYVLDLIDCFTDMWGSYRITHYNEWKGLGEAVFNAHKGKPEGLLDWKKFSKKLIDRYLKTGKKLPDFLCTGDIEYEYQKIYNSFLTQRITVISIAEAAREDSPDKFALWHANWFTDALYKCVCIDKGFRTAVSNIRLARAIYKVYFLEVICEISSTKKVTWYYLFDHGLKKDPGAAKFTKKIADEFCLYFKKMRSSLTEDLANTNSNNKNQDIDVETILDNIKNVIFKLEDISFIEKVINASKIYFNRPGLSLFLGENLDLTCANSCVLVASDGTIYTRDGRLEDFIDKRLQARYFKGYDLINPETGTKRGWEDPGVKILYEWAKQTFCGRENGTPKQQENMRMVAWWWTLQASYLQGGNDEKIFPIVLGKDGNEGKSAWIRGACITMGELASKADMSYFTKKVKDPNQATPVTAGFKGVRVVFIEEADPNSVIQSGPMKEKTGKSTVRCRGLGQDGGPMTLQATFVSASNIGPQFSVRDSAVNERVVVVEIKTQRCVDAPKDIDLQYEQKKFERFNYFDRDLEYYGSAFLWLQCQFFPNYARGELKSAGLPEQIKKSTDKYWQESDKYYKFTTEMYDKTEDRSDKVELYDVYDVFTEWFERRYPKTHIPNIDTLHAELRNKWKKPKDSTWSGYKLKELKQRKTNTSALRREKQYEEFDPSSVGIECI